MEGRADRASLESVVVRFPSEDGIDRQDGAGAHRHQLDLRGALDEHREYRGLLYRCAGGELAVMGQQDGSLVADRLRDYATFLVPDRRARPFAKPRAVLVKQGRIHVRDRKRHADH